jgi:hypothetical protein
MQVGWCGLSETPLILFSFSKLELISMWSNQYVFLRHKNSAEHFIRQSSASEIRCLIDLSWRMMALERGLERCPAIRGTAHLGLAGAIETVVVAHQAIVFVLGTPATP